MRKKIIIIILLALMLCGCDATYSLVVDENFEITENLTVRKEVNSFTKDQDKSLYVNNILTFYNESILYPINELNYYTNSSYVGVHSGKKYDSITTFKNSSFCKNTSCNIDNSFSIDDETMEKMYYFNLSFNFDSYMFFSAEKDSDYYIDAIIIQITFPYKVIETNADGKNGNIYYWNLNSTREFRNLSLIYDPTKYYDSNEDNEELNNNSNVNNNPISQNNTNIINTESNNNTFLINDSNVKHPYIVYTLLVLLVVLIIALFVMLARKRKR